MKVTADKSKVGKKDWGVRVQIFGVCLNDLGTNDAKCHREVA